MTAKKSKGGGRNPRADKNGGGGGKGMFGRPLSESERWVYGFVLMFISLYILLSVVSYYFTWSDDQSVIREGWSAVSGVSNSAGKLGAFIGATFVARWFGLFAIGIPVVFIIFSFRIMRYRRLSFSRSMRITLLAMILGSLTLGYLFGTNWGVFGTGLGGEAGIAVSSWLASYIGKVGLGLLLLMCWVLLAVYINRSKTIRAVNEVGGAVAKGAGSILAGLRGKPKGSGG